MLQTAVLTKPLPAITPSPGQVICIHPHAETAAHVYEFIATVASNDTLKRCEALVLVANPCLAAINRAIRDTLGDRWFCTTFEVA
jgi:hypothetical protein